MTHSHRPRKITTARLGIYLFLLISALFFLLPVFVMFNTSLKSVGEITPGSLLTLPLHPSFDAWHTAWSRACTGLTCNGIRSGFINSIKILLPSVILSVLIGSWTGYLLTFWRNRWSELFFAILLAGAFIPYQVYLYPLVRIFFTSGIYNSLASVVIVHIIFGLPIVTLLFRNFYYSVPVELFSAARVDGGGIVSIYWRIILPVSTPILVVATLLQSTGIWNDFLFGLTFAGRDNYPMTVQLNNIVNSTEGNQTYNVNMAATLLTALAPLVLYLVCGRWLVRGITSGSVKG